MKVILIGLVLWLVGIYLLILDRGRTSRAEEEWLYNLKRAEMEDDRPKSKK